MKEKTFYGKLDKKSNLFLDQKAINSFLSMFTLEQRVSITIRVMSDNISNKYLNWYNFYLVPLFIQAFREQGFEYNNLDAELKMRSMVSFMALTEFNGIKWVVTGYKEVSEFSNDEMRTYIDQLIIEAVDMNMNIELPY